MAPMRSLFGWVMLGKHLLDMVIYEVCNVQAGYENTIS